MRAAQLAEDSVDFLHSFLLFSLFLFLFSLALPCEFELISQWLREWMMDRWWWW
jgi:hypothetical protein